MSEAMESRFWLVLHEPHCVPQLKGPFQEKRRAQVLREFVSARPRAIITYLTFDLCRPYVDDGTVVLEMTDGRSRSTAAKHRASVRAAFRDGRSEWEIERDIRRSRIAEIAGGRDG